MSEVKVSHSEGEASATVTITGSGFTLSKKLLCRFGWTTVAASFIDATRVSCVTPKASVGSAEVRVTTNGADYSASSAEFSFAEGVQVTGVEPRSGTSAGGVTVTVTGSGFVDTADLACRFGTTDAGRDTGASMAAATYESATQLTCMSPAASTAGSVAVEVTVNGDDFTEGGVQYRNEIGRAHV